MRPEMMDDAWVICVRGAGSDAVLARYRKELGSAVTRELDGERETEMWRAIEGFPLLQRGDGSKADRWCYGVVNAPIAELPGNIRHRMGSRHLRQPMVTRRAALIGRALASATCYLRASREAMPAF